MDRTILLASFILPEKLEIFLSFLNKRFNIPKDKVFIFKNLNDESKFIVTFKIILIDGKKIDLRKTFDNAIIIHKNGTVIYTINSLNMLIEKESGLDKGNINYETYNIDWSKYKNKMILTDKNNLVFLNTERIFIE